MTADTPEPPRPSGGPDLEQVVRDERARREHAEQALEQARHNVEVWRRRAEERAARIRELRRPRARVRAWLSRGAPRTAEPSPPRPAGATVPSAAPDARPDRAFPAVRAVHVTANGSPLRSLLAEFDAVHLDAVGRGPVDPDLFVVEDAALAVLPTESRERLDGWLAEPGRAPVVRVTADPAAPAPVVDADVTVDLRTWVAGGVAFLPWFGRDIVVRLPDATRPVVEVTGEDGLLVARTGDGPLAAWHGAALDPWRHPGAVALMAAGVPVLPVEDGPDADRDLPLLPEPWDLARTSVAQRRAAHLATSSARRAADLAALAGVPVASRPHGAAAVLVSNRPERVPDAVERVLAQTAAGLELHVGLHGGGPRALHERVRARAEDAGVPTVVVDLPQDRTLGWCLNAVIEGSTTAAVAKIDDDDHYGPNHLLDAVQALDYAGADLVGKASYLAYVVEDDVTYLVNAGKEEVSAGSLSMIGGSLVLRRSAWERCPFPDRPRRVDSLLLRAARAQALRAYATSRFEFVYERRAAGHTWGAAADRFRARAEVVASGLDPSVYLAR